MKLPIIITSLALALPSLADATYSYVLDSGKATITGFVNGVTPGGALTIPATVDSYQVVAIDRAAFRGQAALTGISFASGNAVTSLGPEAFAECPLLTTATLPSGVTKVPMGLCHDCPALTSVTLPAGALSIGSSAFANCGQLAGVSLPSTLEALGDGVFSRCDSLTSLILPAGVTAIPAHAFDGCSSLAALTLTNGITSIGASAFRDCAVFTSFNFPADTVSVGDRAFDGCVQLTSVTVNAALASLGEEVFANCPSLSSITVDGANAVFSSVDGVLFDASGTVLTFAPPAFAESYEIPATVTALAPGAFDHNSATAITLPASLTDLPEGAFYYSQLAAMEIPGSVTTIGDWALGGSGLTGLTIPATVTSIADDAFHGSLALSWVLFTGDAPTVGEGFFDHAAEDFLIYYIDSFSGWSSPLWSGYPAQALSIAAALAEWLIENGYSPGTDVLADTTGDGVALLTAYALGLDPALNLAASMPQPIATASGLTLTFQGDREGITYGAEYSTDLVGWAAGDIILSEPDANGQRTAELPWGDEKAFMRLVFTP